MALTPLQEHRVAFHLDLVIPDSLLSLDRDMRLSTLSAEQELSLIGSSDLGLIDEDQLVVIDGQNLCTKESVLGRVEETYNKLSPSTIDASLFVSQAGQAKLRGNELQNRRSFYEECCEIMRKLLGVETQGSSSRVGY